MITISNEQAKDLRNAFECWQQDYDPVEDKEQYEMFGLGVVAMDELLALRKEREYPETLPCPVILEPNFRLGKGVRTATMLRALQTRAEHQAELDAMTPEQRAEYEARMDEFKAMLPSPSKDSMSVDAQQAETDTTSQQFESLAGKAVVPEGWKLVPVELTKEMRGKIHPFAEATCLNCGRQVVADCEDNVTASWNDMLAVAPEPCK